MGAFFQLGVLLFVIFICTESIDLETREIKLCMPTWYMDGFYDEYDPPYFVGDIEETSGFDRFRQDNSAENLPGYLEQSSLVNGDENGVGQARGLARAQPPHFRVEDFPERAVPSLGCRNHSEVVTCLRRRASRHNRTNPEMAWNIAHVVAHYNEICAYVHCELPIERDCIQDQDPWFYQEEDVTEETCERLPEIEQCLEPILEHCAQFGTFGDEETEYYREELLYHHYQCDALDCSAAFSRCEILKKIFYYHDDNIMDDGTCVLCNYLPEVTECFINMPDACYDAAQYVFDVWELPLELRRIWTPQVHTFIRNTLRAFYDVTNCEGCIDAIRVCMHDKWSLYFENERHVDQCAYFGEVGHCIADTLIGGCGTIWPPFSNVSREAIIGFSETLQLICTLSHAIDEEEECLLEQFNCIDMAPALSIMFSTVFELMLGDAFGEEFLMEYMGDLDFYELLRFVVNTEGYANEIDDPESVCRLFSYEAQRCHARAVRDFCSWRGHNIQPLVQSMASLMQAGCWLFGDPDHYSVSSMVDLDWFSHMSEDVIRQMREMMLAIIPFSSARPEVFEPDGEHVVTIRLLLDIPFNERFADTDHPQTRRFSAAFEEALYDVLHDSIEQANLRRVAVNEYYRGSLGVETNLIFEHGLSNTLRSNIGLEVAATLNAVERHLEINGLQYDVSGLQIVGTNLEGETVTMPISLDRPTDQCYFFQTLRLCGRGFCEVEVNRGPICRCPDNTFGVSCMDHPIIIERGSSEESDESGDSVHEDLGLVMAAVIMGIVGLLLVAMATVLICNSLRRNRKSRDGVRPMVPLPRTPYQQPMYYPVSVPVQQIPVIQPETVSWVPTGTVRSPPTYFQNATIPTITGSMRRIPTSDKPVYMEEWKTEPFFG